MRVAFLALFLVACLAGTSAGADPAEAQFHAACSVFEKGGTVYALSLFLGLRETYPAYRAAEVERRIVACKVKLGYPADADPARILREARPAAALLGEARGKHGPVIRKGATPGSRVVVFTYWLDLAGAKHVAAALEREAAIATRQRNAERAARLGRLLAAFTADGYRDAATLIRKVSVAGEFQGWKPGLDALARTDSASGPAYRLAPECNVERARSPYKYVFLMGDSEQQSAWENIWVNDPLAVEEIDDGFGGTNSLLVIPDFK